MTGLQLSGVKYGDRARRIMDGRMQAIRRTNRIVFHHTHRQSGSRSCKGVEEASHGHGDEADVDQTSLSYSRNSQELANRSSGESLRDECEWRSSKGGYVLLQCNCVPFLAILTVFLWVVVARLCRSSVVWCYHKRLSRESQISRQKVAPGPEQGLRADRCWDG